MKKYSGLSLLTAISLGLTPIAAVAQSNITPVPGFTVVASPIPTPIATSFPTRVFTVVASPLPTSNPTRVFTVIASPIATLIPYATITPTRTPTSARTRISGEATAVPVTPLVTRVATLNIPIADTPAPTATPTPLTENPPPQVCSPTKISKFGARNGGRIKAGGRIQGLVSLENCQTSNDEVVFQLFLNGNQQRECFIDSRSINPNSGLVTFSLDGRLLKRARRVRSVSLVVSSAQQQQTIASQFVKGIKGPVADSLGHPRIASSVCKMTLVP